MLVFVFDCRVIIDVNCGTQTCCESLELGVKVEKQSGKEHRTQTVLLQWKSASFKSAKLLN